MRVFNVFGIIGALGVLLYCLLTVVEVQELVLENRNNGFFGRKNNFFVGLTNMGLNGAFIMIFVGIFYGILYGNNLKKNNYLTVKVMGGVGISLAVIFVIFNIVLIALNGGIDFGVTFLLWVLFGFLSLVFSIVLLVQSVKAFRGPKKIHEDEDVLHEVEADFDFE